MFDEHDSNWSYRITPTTTFQIQRVSSGNVHQEVATGRCFGDGEVRWSFNKDLHLSSSEMSEIIQQYLQPFEETDPGRVTIEDAPADWLGVDPSLKDQVQEIWTAGRDAAMEAFLSKMRSYPLD